MDYVKIKKKRVFIDNGILYLEHFDIHEINEIKRLNKFPDLFALYLEKNKLTKIDRINHLVNLRKLHSSFGSKSNF
jgi:hypothetical protein